MIDFKEIEKAGNEAVEKLRVSKLLSGIPFMINSEDLPSTECYLEYPDGHISLATIAASKTDFHIIRNLNHKETLALRKKFNLVEVHA